MNILARHARRLPGEHYPPVPGLHGQYGHTIMPREREGSGQRRYSMKEKTKLIHDILLIATSRGVKPYADMFFSLAFASLPALRKIKKDMEGKIK